MPNKSLNKHMDDAKRDAPKCPCCGLSTYVFRSKMLGTNMWVCHRGPKSHAVGMPHETPVWWDENDRGRFRPLNETEER